MEITRRKLVHGLRFLSFTLDTENYCMDILSVRELMGMTDVTPLPGTPGFIRGVINLRGQIIPVIDLRLKFGLTFRDYSKRTCIIVTEIAGNNGGVLMGLVVDAIQDVVSIPEEKVSKIPYVTAKIKQDYIKGVADTPEGMKIILDVPSVLSDDELGAVHETADCPVAAGITQNI